MYKMTNCNLWIPREFYWENTSKADCNHYIDLLNQKKLLEAKVFEEKKLATEHIYERGDFVDKPFVKVNATRLIAILRGEELLEIPLDSRIRFIPERGRYTNNDLDAALFSEGVTEEYFKALRKAVGEGKPVVCCNMPDDKLLLEKYGFRLSDAAAHTGCNLFVKKDTDGEVVLDDVEQAPAPVSETVVKSEDMDTHTETVSLITGNAQVPYFVRRLIRDQHLLWCGTSYQPDGPWTEHTRDQARLTALGISCQ
jgi:hypothetical protein